ncbi:hypothetical protein M422DRAFT_55381, partial [Sphaerobolus stellatus SS14]
MASKLAQKVWVITGTSTGLGRELVSAVLLRGDKVIATARSLDKIKDLEESNPGRCRALQLDVTSEFSEIREKAKEAIDMWGRADVLVNNAGFGLFSTVEEGG